MKRYKHDLSYYRLTTAKIGQTLPIGCTEILPGDSVLHQTNSVIRMSPMLAPVMHRADVRIHHYFVPNRLTMGDAEWEGFITGETADTIPTITYNPATANAVLSGLGLPTGRTEYDEDTTRNVNAMPLYAFNKIWNEYYQDEDIQTDRADTDTTTPLANWGKDYFTTARTTPQRGTEVSLPLGTTAPVQGTGTLTKVYNNSDATLSNLRTTTAGDVEVGTAPSAVGNLLFDSDSANIGLEADLSGATAANVRDVRLAFALQRWQEARNMYGHKYVDYLRYMGIKSSDARHQKPEYLGGGKATISFSEVLQTAEGTDPVGEMRGHGISALRSNRYMKFFEEHGYIISVMSVLPRNIYVDATPRHFLKQDKEEYWQKELAGIGHQEVYKGELFPDTDANDRATFGYSQRYNEYYSNLSQVSGDFNDTLDHWHFGRMFSAPPTLNSSFLECNPTIRQFADNSSDHMWCFVNHRMKARRLCKKIPVGRII